jgi:hypothetical protein
MALKLGYFMVNRAPSDTQLSPFRVSRSNFASIYCSHITQHKNLFKQAQLNKFLAQVDRVFTQQILDTFEFVT